MKALVLEKPMLLEYRDVPDPVLSDDRSVLVRLKASAICGSDVHGMDGSTGRRMPPRDGPRGLGRHRRGRQGVKGFAEGDRVTFDSTIYCGECFFCRRGQPNLCDNRRVLGVSCADYKQDGTFAELVVVPDRILYKLPDNLDFISASLTEPLAVAAHAARIGKPRGRRFHPGGGRRPYRPAPDTGTAGQLLRPHHSRGHGQFQAGDCPALRRGSYGAGRSGRRRKVQELTQGRGADQAFEAVGATAPIETAVQSLRKGGTLTLIGNVSPRIELPLQAVVTRQLTLKGSCAISGEYPFALGSHGLGQG
jgi:L-iditol 2-dehydrogenase